VGLYPSSNLVAVKAPVFSFQKLNDVDVALSPEMKSTGEVLGIDTEYEKALLKAFMAAGIPIINSGNVLVSLRKNDLPESLELVEKLISLGFKIITTEGNAEFYRKNGIEISTIDKTNTELIQSKMKNNEINIVINTPTKGKDPQKYGFKIRSLSQQYKIPCFTSLDTANAYITAIETYRNSNDITYETINYYKNLELEAVIA